MSTRTPSTRAPRTLAQKLGAIVLGFEAIVVFLAGLTVYGLGVLPASVPDWWGIVGGGALAVAMIVLSGAIARPGAIAVGWMLQALVLASALLVPAIALVALVFGGMWGYATIVGARMDRSAVADRAQPQTHPQPGTHPQSETHTESE
ncbi:DUF4233 domain-containing protein [Microbacterium sp. ARD32]|uniref:DUF4233 domain-containing protein n=1 Tax=Microbacterium sp. ARD32 TaxID=2962577 RepID=UPI002881C106|nr:DUF4233 domain-containing protein [Microbacterium sp. ARD32]MDT0157443.1 DUF4233 domain-containing protein [Microbacterium sp. ARD32]